MSDHQSEDGQTCCWLRLYISISDFEQSYDGDVGGSTAEALEELQEL